VTTVEDRTRDGCPVGRTAAIGCDRTARNEAELIEEGELRRGAAQRSLGIPSTRWAMMPRWISEVPAAIVRPREYSIR